MSQNMQRKLLKLSTNTAKYFALFVGIDCYVTIHIAWWSFLQEPSWMRA